MQLPRITKNLLIANLVVYGLGLVIDKYMLQNLFGLWSLSSGYFHLWQPFTYMFLHANFSHFFFNMFALWMFGPAIEQRWGEQKYLFYYIFSGAGAALVQELVWNMMGSGFAVTVGASGAIFGVLLAFGWLFPDVKMFLLFIPIPIPSRIFVGLYALVELFEGVMPSNTDNVAHFAHLGGMLFGALLILYWRLRRDESVAYHEDTETRETLRRWWELLQTKLRREKKESARTNLHYHYQAPVRDNNKEEEAEQPREDQERERILQKIRRGGYEALTQEEKDYLFKK